ncbi:peptide chain release factor N(5)-glutamine methyltransferase [Pontibacillus marinus]|uniref:Release factor glutamine methyltransferase n=1 Tax=Pontibacillus marinus BH030004 = DSM 16465 TaxID=1385511 RepID=A0A0A5G822_9BACI|nr:peptide chain release factor N(5)-glutamine methyltransferase [Pontibacillus marinus]KGX87260.1 hypothetical protein N783_10020 [Pontibacillus marinus BH030004 = DSM 16465]
MAKTIFEARRWASLFLEENNRETNVGMLLLQHHMGMSRAQLLAESRSELPEETWSQFQKDIEKHAETGVPVQHLIGSEEFFGRTFNVNNHVLIPRPETEELVLGVINRLRQKERPLRGVDIGTGSGIIAITLALEIEGLSTHATDLSIDALNVARENARQLDADVHFSRGDFLESLMEHNEKMDLIVSNPPYIPERDRESLEDVVEKYDPDMALFADDNGLAAYKKIMKQVPQVANEGALLAFEIGHDQGEAVSNIIKDTYPQSEPQVEKDINGKDRMIFAWI